MASAIHANVDKAAVTHGRFGCDGVESGGGDGFRRALCISYSKAMKTMTVDDPSIPIRCSTADTRPDWVLVEPSSIFSSIETLVSAIS